MKKITLFIFLLSISFCFGQAWTTGTVSLDSDFTVKFDVDASTSLVTMTLIGPSNVWLGVAPGVSAGNMMGNAGDDVVVYNSIGLQDRNMLAGNGQPNLDASQDWTITSNTTLIGVRTIVATRAINTGDANDYIFPTATGPIPLLWAKGGGLTFGYHTGGRGGTVANLTLGVDRFALTNFSVSPNPSASNFTITLPTKNNSAKVEVYSMLGKQILTKQLKEQRTNIEVSQWNSGIYLIKVTVNDFTQTKRFVKS
ncbi:T9SS type A sorting domain-containing protein [uncultured Kordia sp.]|uniref:T9SS type A sorting domain-containing protein n=1 Tax=uncultured Kordia sp. TaxID=507699 RepID=UPI002622B842|nr:T9SS type A sorting domain-containing protein [uncultured Kordia sp.]